MQTKLTAPFLNRIMGLTIHCSEMLDFTQSLKSGKHQTEFVVLTRRLQLLGFRLSKLERTKL